MYNYSVWNQVVQPGKRVRVFPETDIRLTSVTFGEKIVEENGRTTIKLFRVIMPDVDSDEEDEEDEDEDEEPKLEFEPTAVVLAHLTPGKIETQTLDLILNEREPFELEITGKNPVHLVGNYVDQSPAGPYDDFSDSDEEEDGEEGYGLDEVSSDVEIDPRDIVMEGSDDSDDETDEEEPPHAKIEVVEPKKEEKEKSKKRARESDPAPEAAEEKKDKKDKKQKKLKTEDGTAAPAPEVKSEKKEKKEEKKPKGQVHTTKSGVTVDVRKPGSGPGAKAGQRLQMRYIGKLANGNVFDKNIKGKPFSFVLGKGEVIKGWDEGLAGLPVGAEAIITVPPSAGYGGKKMDGIPANSTLTFEVKVLAFK